MSDKKIAIVGYSGHGYVVAEAALEAGLSLGFYAEKKEVSLNVFKLTYLGFEGSNEFKGWNNDFDFILGIGDNKVRQKVALDILQKEKELLNVFHPSADISKTAQFGKGNFVSKNVSVNALAVIGNFCILNTGSIVEHECRIADAVHIGPGAVLAGNVEVGQNTFIGANAVVKQGVKIGENVIIGAGAVVINNVESNSCYVGNPAKKIK